MKFYIRSDSPQKTIITTGKTNLWIENVVTYCSIAKCANILSEESGWYADIPHVPLVIPEEYMTWE